MRQLILIYLVLFTMTNCATKQGKLEFPDYPDFKVGFTSQNFINCVPVTPDNVKMLLDYAAGKGFAFFELRDPDAVLTPEECTGIADYAREKNIEVAYANQRGLLDPDFWEVFRKGVLNATAFSGPKTIRATISGTNFLENPEKAGLTMDELTKSVEIANKAAVMAEEKGIQLVVENGSEPFTETVDSIYGLESFFQRINSNVAWQFDTGNPFAGKNTYADPGAVKQYLEKHAGRISYIHLKSAQNREAQKVLCENDLDFKEIFRILSANQIGFIAIELVADSVENTVFENMDKSLEYLRTQGYLKY